MLQHERFLLEKEEYLNSTSGNLPLLVLDWILLLLKRVSRQGNSLNINDLNRNVENIMTFKKSCGNAIKFSAKNIPFALIQVRNLVFSFNIQLSATGEGVKRLCIYLFITGCNNYRLFFRNSLFDVTPFHGEEPDYFNHFGILSHFARHSSWFYDLGFIIFRCYFSTLNLIGRSISSILPGWVLDGLQQIRSARMTTTLTSESSSSFTWT